MAEKYVTKPGRHGTLYLYAVRYRDRYDPAFGEDVVRLWGYSMDHVEERFYDESGDETGDGFVIVDIARVQARTSQHRAVRHAPRGYGPRG